MPDTSCFEEAFLKVMGKEAPIEVMDMEKAMSAAGLFDMFDVEVRWHEFALRFQYCRVACAVCRIGRQSTLAANFRHA